ncbi:MAG: hypothetical protein LUD39_01220 [Opitutae bacterium]|nr:hypothetical protein [Opitutae bacterium]MCD8298368.1 hypothetical protein [Opitutae bacterium]
MLIYLIGILVLLFPACHHFEEKEYIAEIPFEKSVFSYDDETCSSDKFDENKVRSEYTFSRYKKNATRSGAPIYGTGLNEELYGGLSIIKDVSRREKSGSESWSQVEFPFAGKKCLFLLNGRGSPCKSEIYTGDKYENRAQTLAPKTHIGYGYLREAALIPLSHGGKEFLAIVINGNLPQHPWQEECAVVYVLDNYFNIVYKDIIFSHVGNAGALKEDGFYVVDWDFDDRGKWTLYKFK